MQYLELRLALRKANTESEYHKMLWSQLGFGRTVEHLAQEAIQFSLGVSYDTCHLKDIDRSAKRANRLDSVDDGAVFGEFKSFEDIARNRMVSDTRGLDEQFEP